MTSSTIRRAVVIAAIAALGAAGLASAGLPQDRTAGSDPNRGAQPAVLVLNSTVSVDFKGGTVGEYLDALKEASTQMPVNVVISDEARRVQMGPVSLKLASIGTAVAAIEAAAGSDSAAWKIQPIREFGHNDARPGAAEVYRVLYRALSPRDSDAEWVQRAYAIRQLTEPRPDDAPGSTLTPETLLSAVQAAVELHDVEMNQKTRVLFHKESGILLISGTPRVADQVRDVLGQLRDQRDQLRPVLPAASYEFERAARELLGVRTAADIETKKKEIDAVFLERAVAEAQMREMQKLTSEKQDMINAQLAVLRKTNEELVTERVRLQAEISELTAKLKDATSKK